MKRTTIKKLAKIAKTSDTPLLGKATDLANISFMAEYLSAYSLIDRNMQVNRGCFAPIWNRDEEDTDEDVLSQFQDDIYGLLIKNQNEYQRIWDALVVAEYDPISNYDKHSVITVEHSGEDNDTSTIGARHREETYAQKQNTDAYGAVSHTDSFGAQQNSTVHGAQEITDAYGAVSQSDTIGARSDTLTHGAQTNTDNFGAVSETTTHGAKEIGTTGKRAGFNTTTLKTVDGATTNEGAQSDGHTEAARSDSHTTAQYMDTNAVGAQTNGHTENAKTDTHTLATYTDTDNIGAQQNTHTELAKSDTHTEGAHKDEFDDRQATDTLKKEFDSTFTTTENTHGNIGVKDNNQLITGEMELRLRFKFYDVLENDIIKELCTLENDGYDCF